MCAAEINALKEVAMAMGMSDSEVESMLNLKGSSLDDAYKVLEIEPTATDEEVRAAYRRMAVKHHPDKVASLGEDIRKAANEKFQKINEAKERIYQSRGSKSDSTNSITYELSANYIYRYLLYDVNILSP